MTPAFIVSARTERSSMGVGTPCRTDALQRAQDMAGPRVTVIITDAQGMRYTVEAFAAVADQDALRQGAMGNAIS